MGKKSCAALLTRRKGGASVSCIHLEQPADRLAYFTSRLFPGKVEALFMFGEETAYAQTLCALRNNALLSSVSLSLDYKNSLTERLQLS